MEDVHRLWMRVVSDSRQELERLRRERPDLNLEQDLDTLFAAHWPQARQAAIEALAREEAGDDERQYEELCHRLDLELPRDYPYIHGRGGPKR